MTWRCFPTLREPAHGTSTYYAIGDVVARFKTMNGFNVLHQWDGIHWSAGGKCGFTPRCSPARWTDANIDNMREQLKGMT